MTDFRYDPLFDQWVCIAESRQSRPIEFQQDVRRRAGLDCPFCQGQEDQTPAPLVELDSADGWLVRAFPNKYPAMAPEPINTCPPDNDRPSGGRQEVIVVTPRHVVSWSDLNDRELAASMQVFRDRIADYWSDSSIAHVALFMNCRAAAGASIEHAHFQLMGSPVCTRQVQERVSNMCRLDSGRSLWQSEMERERAAEVRVVDETDAFTIFCPWASRYTGMLRFAPNRNQSFAELEIAQFAQLGKSMAHWTRVMEHVLQHPGYNLVFFLPPNNNPGGPWFVDLIPRFPQFAGFELATDCWVNPLSPESAASRYRDESAAE